MAATRLFSLSIVHRPLDRSSRSISLQTEPNHRALALKLKWHSCETSYCKLALIVLKSGRLCGSYDQHSDMSEYKLGGQLGGNGKRSRFSSFSITSLFFIAWNGLTPIIKISQTHTANIHTSLAVVKRRKLIDSGAIHLMGSLPFVEW